MTVVDFADMKIFWALKNVVSNPTLQGIQFQPSQWRKQWCNCVEQLKKKEAVLETIRHLAIGLKTAAQPEFGDVMGECPTDSDFDDE